MLIESDREQCDGSSDMMRMMVTPRFFRYGNCNRNEE